MIDPTYFDVVLQDHAGRVQPVNQTGWQRAVVADVEERPAPAEPSGGLRLLVHVRRLPQSMRGLTVSLARRLVGPNAPHQVPLE